MSTETIFLTTIKISNKTWTLLASKLGICRLLFQHESLQDAQKWLDQHATRYVLIEDRSVFVEFGIVDRLERYFAGLAVGFENVPLDLRGTPFQQEIWRELGRIPYGKTRTYKQLAETIGKPKALRAVGAANGRNPLPIILPCHRVIGGNNTLTGYRGGLCMKKELLELEGVTYVEASGHERFVF